MKVAFTPFKLIFFGLQAYILVFGAFITPLKAQNLVPNHGFELYNMCPPWLGAGGPLREYHGFQRDSRDYMAPNFFKYFIELAFVASVGFIDKDFLKFFIAFSLSPFIAYASPRLSHAFALSGCFSVLTVKT